MLKLYNVQNLRPGMKVGRDVKGMGGILIANGTILDAKSLKTLAANNIVSIYIDESKEEATSDVPGREHLLDEEYVERYDKIFRRTKNIFDTLAIHRELKMNELEKIVEKDNIDFLCDGARAVSQIHNMPREGDYIIHHSIHVGILAGLMARWIHWSLERTQDLMMAAILHDVGKLKIAPSVLEKEGKLDQEEWQKMQRHPEFSFDMLKNTKLRPKKDILEGVWQHHERCDGSGYQNHLVKDQINPFARIIAILDIYDAMATNRSYAQRKSPFDVIKVLYTDVLDGRLDIEFAVPFMKQLLKALNGNWLGLSDGQRAKIVYINDASVTSLPVVQTLSGQFIDLNTNKKLKIEYVLTANEVG